MNLGRLREMVVVGGCGRKRIGETLAGIRGVADFLTLNTFGLPVPYNSGGTKFN